jgi:hypothetical protein
VRFTKMLGLAAIAALASMAFMAASAQAVHLEVLCKKDPGKNLCLAGELWKTGTLIEALNEPYLGSNHAILLSSGALGNELCEHSEVKGKITKTSKIHGLIEKVTFTGNCKPCSTVTVSGLPFLVEVVHLPEGKTHLWLLKVTGAIKATFTGCPLGAKCVFETSEVDLDATNTATDVLILTLENKLVRNNAESSFGCPSEGKWDANYLVLTPTPAFLALDEKTEA